MELISLDCKTIKAEAGVMAQQVRALLFQGTQIQFPTLGLGNSKPVSSAPGNLRPQVNISNES